MDPDPIPASYYKRDLKLPALARPKKTWYRPIPGFRTGKRWKEILAVCGYVLIAAWIVQAPTNPLLSLLGALCLITVFLATNAGGLRGRLPVLRSGNPLVAGTGWLAIGLVLIGVAAAEQPTGSPSLSNSSTAANTRPYAPRSESVPSPTQAASAVRTTTPSPSPKPSPSPSPSPTPTPVASPTPPAPATTPIAFVNAPLTAAPGQNVTLYVRTAPGAACNITVYYASGPSTAKGLTPKTADGAGNVSWTWKVGTRTTPGSWDVVVGCGNATATTTLNVT
jgi:hypothetical protein